MALQTDTIDHQTLQRMQAAGVVSDALLVAEPNGWACVVEVRRTQYPLRTKRGEVRHWSRMESAARYLRGLGIGEFRVDARELPERRPRRAYRPDAAAKLKRAHKAAAYERWFNEQVAEAIREADSPDAVWLSHEEVEAEFAERRAQTQTRQRLAESE